MYFSLSFSDTYAHHAAGPSTEVLAYSFKLASRSLVSFAKGLNYRCTAVYYNLDEREAVMHATEINEKQCEQRRQCGVT